MVSISQDDLGGKTCPKCHQWKPYSEFYMRSGSLDGRQGHCKVCQRARAYKRYHEDIEASRQRNHEYYWANAERERKKALERRNAKLAEDREGFLAREREKDRKYRQTPQWREQHRRNTRRWAQNNRDKIREIAKRCYRKNYEKNRPKLRIKWRRQRARRRNAEGSHTVEEWQALCEKRNNKCLACGKEGDLTADHIVPLARGGTDYIDNIQPLCGHCNSSKGTKTIDYRG